MFTGDGGYQFAHFSIPPTNVKEQYFEKGAQNSIDDIRRLGFLEDNTINLLGILTSFDSLPYKSTAHSPFAALSLLDGVAWHTPTGTIYSYWDSSLDNSRSGINVGKQPRLLGTYSKTNHAELQRRRAQAIANGGKQYSQILQMTIDKLVQDGKIKLN